MKVEAFGFVRTTPVLNLIIGGAMFIVGILISDLPKMMISQGWPTTEGVILYHQFEGQQFKEYDGDIYKNIDVHIRYEYEVNGVEYTSLTINLIDNPFNLYPPHYASRYPVGKEVIVSYNPKKPSEAVLEPGFVDIFREFDVFACLLL